VSLLLPSNARGPVLDLVLPASEQAIDIVLRNKTTGESLTLALPEDWDGTDLSLDFRRRTIVDTTGADRSSLLDPSDSGLWKTEPLITGANAIEIEAVGAALVAKDDFNQTAGPVTGKSLETGGTWEGEGDADDFSVVAGSEHLLRRSAVSDAATYKGRLIKASTPSVAATRVVTDFFASADPSTSPFQVILPSACARIGTGGVRLESLIQWSNPVGTSELRLFLQIKEEGLAGAKAPILGEAGPLTAIKEAALGGARLRMILECVGGEAKAFLFPLSEPNSGPLLAGKHEYLEGKGAKNLSSGKVGVYDATTTATAPTRSFDRFRAYDLSGKGSYTAKATLRWEKGYY